MVNVGHRDLLLPAEHIARYYRATVPAARLQLEPAGVCEQLRDLASRAGAVFLDIDCDVFDPAHFPAVGEPVPFGLAPPAVLTLQLDTPVARPPGVEQRWLGAQLYDLRTTPTGWPLRQATVALLLALLLLAGLLLLYRLYRAGYGALALISVAGFSLRVYRLPAVHLLPYTPAYGGCKSWVELERAILLENMTPVLDDVAYAAKREAVRAALRR